MKKLRILNNTLAIILTAITFFYQLSIGQLSFINCFKVMVVIALVLGISETLIGKLINKIRKTA